MIPPPLSSRLILFTAYTHKGICFESIQPFKDFYCAEIRTDLKKKAGIKNKGDLLLGHCLFRLHLLCMVTQRTGCGRR